MPLTNNTIKRLCRTCKPHWQDRYGKNIRVHNLGKESKKEPHRQFVCTVCGTGNGT